MKRIKQFFGLVVAAFKEWQEDKASRMAAALAYYTLFSLAPIIVIVLTIVSFVMQGANISDVFLEQIGNLMGDSGVEVIEGLINNSAQPAAGIIATVISVFTAIFGATGVFVQLKDALNTAWGVKAEEESKGIKGLVLTRVIALSATLVIGFLLMVSLLLSTFISTITANIPGSGLLNTSLIQLLNQAVSIGLIMLLFAFIFKFLPDVEIAWKDVWIGALFTSVLFNVGKFLIGLYLGNSNVGSAFGAAGSILVVLVWVYYSAQILLYGAEFTQVYSDKYGSWADKESPKKVAKRIVTPEPAKAKAKAAEPYVVRRDYKLPEEKRTKAEQFGQKLGRLALIGSVGVSIISALANYSRKNRN